MNVASLPQGILFVVLNHQKCIGSENFDRLSISLSASDYFRTCFDKNTVWVHHNASAGDFISIVLLRTLRGAMGSSVKLDALENN